MSEIFGMMLRHLRVEAGLSQPALARQVPVSQAHLARYESGQQRPDSATIDRLDEVLGADGRLSRLLAPAAPAPVQPMSASWTDAAGRVHLHSTGADATLCGKPVGLHTATYPVVACASCVAQSFLAFARTRP